jgi:hypothetical protein
MHPPPCKERRERENYVLSAPLLFGPPARDGLVVNFFMIVFVFAASVRSGPSTAVAQRLYYEVFLSTRTDLSIRSGPPRQPFRAEHRDKCIMYIMHPS